MEKNEIIIEIKKMVNTHGDSISSGELGLGYPPVFNTITKDHVILVERFNHETVTIITYVHETEIAEDDLPYENLEKDLLEEILDILEDSQLK